MTQTEKTKLARRIGRFTVTKSLIMGTDTDEDWKAMYALFSRVIPIHIIDKTYETDSLHYIAISQDFEEVELGSKIPYYTVILSKDELENDEFYYTVRFEKTEDPEEYIFT